MAFVLALTGSIGMGKSAAAAMFRAAGVPVWDADAAVHEIYARGGPAVEPVGQRFPDAIVDGAVDRERLSALVVGNDAAIRDLERIVHPLVGEHRAAFRAQADAEGADIVVVDVPLLFETGGEKKVDAVVVVSASAEQQRTRVLDRPGMSVGKFEAILSRQTPDEEKRARAHHVIDTSLTLAETEAQVLRLVAALRERLSLER